MTSLSQEDIRKALQVTKHQPEADFLPGATFSLSSLGILGCSNLVQVHHQSDKDLNLSPLPAHLHDQEISANGACHHGLCDIVRFRKHIGNHCPVHAHSTHLGSQCTWDLHQPHGFLVRECFGEHYWRLLDTCPTYACRQKLAAASTTKNGSCHGLRLGRLVGDASDFPTDCADNRSAFASHRSCG